MEILAYPCNQFGEEEPWPHAQIVEWAKKTHGATFPILDKIDVNGRFAEPLWKWLQNHSNFQSRPKHRYDSRTNSHVPTPNMGDKTIEWNFTKFLISKAGAPLIRTLDDPLSLESAIQKQLQA